MELTREVDFVLSPRPAQFYAMVQDPNGVVQYEGRRYDAYNVNFLAHNRYEIRWQVSRVDRDEIEALEALATV